MADTTYVDFVTPITADTMNDINRLHYTILGDPANAAAVVTALLASQAQQETGTSNSVLVSPGRQQYHPSAAKGWVNYGPSGNIFASHNVASITDTGDGDSNVNWTTAFSSASFAVVATLRGDANTRIPNTFVNGAGASTIVSRDSNFVLTDPLEYYVVAYGDQA